MISRSSGDEYFCVEQLFTGFTVLNVQYSMLNIQYSRNRRMSLGNPETIGRGGWGGMASVVFPGKVFEII